MKGTVRDRTPMEIQEVEECLDHPWHCARCGKLMGYIDADTRTAVRVKLRDAFIWIVCAKIVGYPCTKCGAYNELTDDSVEKLDPPRLPGIPSVLARMPRHVNGTLA